MFTDIVGYTTLMGLDKDGVFVVLNKNRKFYATFSVRDFQSFAKRPVAYVKRLANFSRGKKDPLTSRHLCFNYTKKEIISFAHRNGFKVDYIGSWGHPRNQKIVKFYF